MKKPATTLTINPGTVFSTRFESLCIATNVPDNDGNFPGYDSDLVGVTFNTSMVERTYPHLTVLVNEEKWA